MITLTRSTISRLPTLLLCLLVTAGAVRAEEIRVTVNGMVCAFCAQGIKKQFSAVEGVERVDPDLEHRLVVIHAKAGATLPDEKIKSIIKDAGYDVVSIERK